MEDIYHVSESQWAFFDVDYSLDLKSQYPEIWAMSGGQKSDEAHAVLLEILGNNGYALTPEQVNVLNLRESWANRHFEDRTALGNIAQVKWLVESFDGEPFQKKSINSEVSKFYLRQEWYAEKGAKGPCWPGYKQVGMKVGKRGTMVPNCVPVGAKDAQESEFDEYDEKSLKKWFKEKWVDISRPKDGGGFEPCGRDNTDGGKYPKCVPASKASKMSAEEIRSAVSRKRKAESSQQRDDKKPINVSTDAKDARFEIEEKSATPTNPELYSRVKAEAKKKFDVYPSAYANAWLVREYKKRGGGYREGKDLDGEFEDNIYDLNEKQLFDFYEWMEEKSAKSKLRNPKGGLTAAGRKYFNRTKGSNLKPGVKGAANTPEKMRRKGSFLTRFFTNPSGPMKDDKGRPTRLALSAAAWGEPVPQDASDAARLAAKGRRMLDRYQNSKKKDAELGIETKAEKQCPPATRDIAINIKKRQKAIDAAGYGPLNPKEANTKFWQEKADSWDVSVSEAKKQKCGNCVMFIKTPEMLDCIQNGLGTEKSSHAWDIINTAELGYCEAFDFKCAASRTCDAWVVGGPITTKRKNQETKIIK